MAQLVDLKVGFSCNNDCIHCVISDKKYEKDLSLLEITRLVEGYIQEYKQIQLTVTGGEITLRKDFLQIMHFVREKKEQKEITFVDMQTNGRMLSIDERLNAAIGVVDFFLIALHSNLPEIHDSITQAHGSFVQTTTALKKLVKVINPKRIAIQTVINRKNFNSLKAIYKFVNEEFGIKECNITFPHPIGVCLSTDVIPSYKEVQPFVNEALSYCLSNGIYPYIEALPFCIFNAKNRKYAFEFLEKRNINVVGYGGERDGQVDYAAVFCEGHIKYSNCSQCPHTQKCEGVWKEHGVLYPQEDMLGLLQQER